MNKRYGIIGGALGHSLSPVIFDYLFKRFEISGDYVRMETNINGLAETVRGIRQNDLSGANITFPHKEAIIPLLDELDATSRQTGAVNTIFNDDGILRGYNTDRAGISSTLKELYQV